VHRVYLSLRVSGRLCAQGVPPLRVSGEAYTPLFLLLRVSGRHIHRYSLLLGSQGGTYTPLYLFLGSQGGYPGGYYTSFLGSWEATLVVYIPPS